MCDPPQVYIIVGKEGEFSRGRQCTWVVVHQDKRELEIWGMLTKFAFHICSNLGQFMLML